MNEVKNFLRPELINRLDELIIFNKLDKEQFDKIFDIQLKNLTKKLADLDLKLIVKPIAKKFIIESMDTNQYGARPLKRKIESLIENKIASLLIEKRETEPSSVDVGVENDELYVKLT